MDLEDALNLELSAYRVERVEHDEIAEFRAELPGYPQCTAYGSSAAEAVRGARHLLTELRDRQAAVSVCEMQASESADRLREAMRTVVARALR